MTWIEELALKRLAQRSNVYLIETFDMKRLQQFKEVVTNGKLEELFKKTYDQVIDYNIQRNEVFNLKNKTKLATDVMASPLKEIDNFLRDTKAIVMIDYAFEERHAEALSDFLAAWSQDSTLYKKRNTVLVFTSDVTLFPETLRRLSYTITIEPSTEEEREKLRDQMKKEIMQGFMEKYGEKLKLEEDPDIIQASAGLNLHDFETCYLQSFFTDRRIGVSAFTDYKIKILKTYNLDYVEPQIDFSLVGGYEVLKTYIRNRVIMPLRNPETANYYGVGLPRGMLLYGIPGTGKTYVSEAVAKELGLAMIKLSPSDLFRGVVGESERRVKQITNLVESLAPVVILVDEVDQIALARGAVMMTDSGVSRRITNMLLEWLGSRKRKSFLIGTTNFLENMDTAFLRSGRVDEVCLVLPPDLTARKEILKIHCNKLRTIPLAGKPTDQNIMIDNVATETFMWTGAELEKLCLDAARIAMEKSDKKIGVNHFANAMKGFDVNIKQRQESVQTSILQIKKMENVSKAFLEDALKEFQTGGDEASRVKTFVEVL